MTLKWNCNSRGCYVKKSLPNWGMLDGCFDPVKADMVSDVDGIVHQRGKCLFLEKKFPSGLIAEPQLRMIASLVAQGNSWIVIWCEDTAGSDISLMRVWGITGHDSRERTVASLESFRSAVKDWWRSVYVKGEK